MRYPLDRMKIRELQFGRMDPISNTFGRVRRAGHRPHQGWDLDTPPGTAVYAISDGELVVGLSPSYGRTITLTFHHGGRTYYAFYAHLRSAMTGNVSVCEGELIGYTGRSGNARGIPADESHLHFEIRTLRHPGRGLKGRIDPGEIFGYGIYSSRLQSM